MSMHEIVLPETKPETEWIAGRAVQKVSPTGLHAQLQSRFSIALTAWSDAADRGRVGTEWRFRIAPPREIVRPLVPDVAFVDFERLPRGASRAAIDLPLVAPTAAIEVLSPGDRPSDVRDKIATYLRAGTSVVVVVDPKRSTICAYHANGTQSWGAGTTFAHPALPDFTLDVGELFRRARRWPLSVSESARSRTQDQRSRSTRDRP